MGGTSAPEMIVSLHKIVAAENWNVPSVFDIICEMYPDESAEISSKKTARLIEAMWKPGVQVERMFGPRSKPIGEKEAGQIKGMLEAGFSEYVVARLLKRSPKEIMRARGGIVSA